MAKSCSKNPYGLNPFELVTLTPGPLGHNDAASADSLLWFLGDTPGALGFNDHADPEVAAKVIHFTDKNKSPADRPGYSPSSLKISQAGLDFIWSEEFVEGISERLHWPKGASGVTLGAGYDMKERSEDEVASDLTGIGVSADVAKKVSKGAGLAGQDADSFVKKNRNLITIDDVQATKLLKLIIVDYESMIQHGVKVPLMQYEFDALVSFAYNPGGKLSKVIKNINKGYIGSAMKQIKSANTSGGKVLKGLVNRRRHEVNLFVKGQYTE